MKSSSEARRAKVLRGAVVQPFRLTPDPLEAQEVGVAGPQPWDGRERRSRSVPEPWDGRDRRSGRELEAAREEAFRVGYDAGRQDAERDAGAVREEMERTLAALQTAVEHLDKLRAEAMAVAEEEVAALAFSVAEAVLQRELELAADPGAEAVARALALLPEETDVVVRLHPEDAARTSDLSDDLRRVTVVADPTVEQGGCVADAGACRIDAQTGTALERVRRVLCGERESA